MVSSLYRIHNSSHKVHDNHGIIHDVLSVITIISTIFFFTFLKPHRLYKRLMSWFFNFSFKWKEVNWKIYHILSLIIAFFIILLTLLKMQLELYAHRGINESHDNRTLRLSYKWLIESELWMVCIIILELTAVYCLSRIGDKKIQLVTELDKLGYDKQRISLIENNY